MKNKFIKSTIILIIGGLITKVLGMIIKIVLTRTIGTEGISEYMLVLPTFSLFIGLGQFGLPIALSKMVAEDKRNNKKLISSLLITSLVINIFLIVFLILFAPILLINYYKKKELTCQFLLWPLLSPLLLLLRLLEVTFLVNKKCSHTSFLTA